MRARRGVCAASSGYNRTVLDVIHPGWPSRNAGPGMDKDTFRTLVPINSLTSENYRELVAGTIIQNLPAGSRVFQRGDRDSQSIFLLSGEVTLTATDAHAGAVLVAGTDEARFALSQLKPRRHTCTARTAVTVARVDSALLDRLLTWDQATGYDVIEYDGGQDPAWMMRMMRSEVLRKVPPSSVLALFSRIEPVEAGAGEVVIRQGDAGDFYYIIKTGTAIVSRRSEETGEVSTVGDLGEGDGFGEEALLSRAPRNATVAMVTEGVLMRLGRRDFDELMREPLVKWVTLDQARTMAQSGAALLDVRTEAEFRHGNLEGSVNLPLYSLRREATRLDPKRRYVALCQTGNRSCAAAFLLSQRGFDVSVLRGGLDGLESRVAPPALVS